MAPSTLSAPGQLPSLEPSMQICVLLPAETRDSSTLPPSIHDYSASVSLTRPELSATRSMLRTGVFGKTELALHALNNARQHLVGFIPISSAEFDAADRPIGIGARFWLFRHDENANEILATWFGFHCFGDRRFQTCARL
jgi:hypothetical protein